jgi:hypothetical protein
VYKNEDRKMGILKAARAEENTGELSEGEESGASEIWAKQ